MTKSKLKLITILLLLITLISVTTLAFGADVFDATSEDEIDADYEDIDDDDLEMQLEEYYNDLTDEDSEDYVLPGEDELISKDLFVTDIGDYNITKTIDGNSFIIGNNVTIDSEMAGDIFIIANKLTINEDGAVYGNIFIIANEINIDGIIYDLYALCSGNINITQNAIVYRDIHATAKKLNLLGRVGRNVEITATDLVLDSNYTMIYGNLNYDTTNNVLIPEGVVTGEITPVKTTKSVPALDLLLEAISAIVFAIVIWLLMMWLAPKFVEKAAGYVPSKLLVSTGLGVLTIIAVPIVSFVLMFTIVGVNVSFALIGILAVLAILATSIFTVAVGTFTGNKMGEKPSKFKNLALIAVVSLVLWALRINTLCRIYSKCYSCCYRNRYGCLFTS